MWWISFTCCVFEVSTVFGFEHMVVGFEKKVWFWWKSQEFSECREGFQMFFKVLSQRGGVLKKYVLANLENLKK